MQKLSEKEVRHIAKLAQLPLSDEEVRTFAEQLSETLDYIERLKELKTEAVQPTYQTTGLKNVFREDEIGPCLSQEEALQNSEETYKGYFKVKAVLGPLNP
ncbi:MAG TPA: Asp-tRNA(Asn)/Glu-tRNA(Gln) amidotransferase subunit GatC [Patescibacteria group bacterium]|nr:Asp-tRNA(Asn)/Glu-tRNA(Gln) amidotransferase subunit GatC [Patescibacteria group bacterium]